MVDLLVSWVTGAECHRIAYDRTLSSPILAPFTGQSTNQFSVWSTSSVLEEAALERNNSVRKPDPPMPMYSVTSTRTSSYQVPLAILALGGGLSPMLDEGMCVDIVESPSAHYPYLLKPRRFDAVAQK